MTAAELRQRFDELRARAEERFAAGALDESCALYDQAFELASAQGDRDLADAATCSRCAVLIELDAADDEIPKLKKILLRSRDPRNRWMAAYYTAVAFDLHAESERAWPYAQRAFEIAAECDDPVLSANSANLRGTLALRTSHFDDAEQAYEAALRVFVQLDGYHEIYRELARDNLGYVLMCTDRVAEGVELCEQALSALEGMDGGHCLAQTLQDLCYGHLLLEGLDRAQECGERALDLASATSEALIVKNCLFLLAEIAVRRGDTFRARRYLRELAAYYPEVGVSEEIIDVFLATDLTAAVNLRG